MSCERDTEAVWWYSTSSFRELNLTTHKKNLPEKGSKSWWNQAGIFKHFQAQCQAFGRCFDWKSFNLKMKSSRNAKIQLALTYLAHPAALWSVVPHHRIWRTTRNRRGSFQTLWPRRLLRAYWKAIFLRLPEWSARSTRSGASSLCSLKVWVLKKGKVSLRLGLRTSVKFQTREFLCTTSISLPQDISYKATV